MSWIFAVTNLGKLRVTIIIIVWAWSKMGEVFIDQETLKSGVITNALMDWADWLNNFCMLIMMD